MSRRITYGKVVAVMIYLKDLLTTADAFLYKHSLDMLRIGLAGYVDEEIWLTEFDKVGLVKQFKKTIEDYDGEDVMFIIAYVGHGNEIDGRLWAISNKFFSLTDMQLHARDYCKSDFLFIIDSCHSEFFPSETIFEPTEQAKKHLVEIISAAKGGMFHGKKDGLIGRLVDNLRETNVVNENTTAKEVKNFKKLNNAYRKANPDKPHDWNEGQSPHGTTVADRSLQICGWSDWSPGFYKSVGKQVGSIELRRGTK